MKLKNSNSSPVHVDFKSRRMFLKSSTGLSLAIPFLPSLLTCYGENAIASVPPPLRYVGVMTPIGGLQNKNWFGTQLPSTPFELYPGQNARVNSLTSLATANGISPVLNSSFNNLWPSMNLIAGVDQPIYLGHNRIAGVGAFAKNTQGLRPLSDQNDLGARGGIIGETPSIDQVIAFAGGNGNYGSALSGRRRNLNIATGSFTCSWGRDDYFTNDPITARDALNSPAGVFNYLFGSVPSVAGQANPLLSLVNAFWPSGKSLLRFLSNQDRSAIDQLFQLAQDASGQYSGQGPVCPASPQPVGSNSTWASDGSSLRALADIIAMAFKCDVTRVATIYIEGNAAGVLDWHALSHQPSTPSPDLGQDGIVTLHASVAQNFMARLGENLRVNDPFGSGTTILDNSLIMWTHENKSAHSNFSTPTLLMGGAGGRIQTGLFADLRDTTVASFVTDNVGDLHYKGELVNRLWTSIFYAMNISKKNYEFSRGGNGQSLAMTEGYGHVLINYDAWNKGPVYSTSKIGAPWEFLMKPNTIWG